MKKLRVLALMHEGLVPPENQDGVDLATVEWKTEFDVMTTLHDLGHEVMAVGVRDDLGVIRKAIESWKPATTTDCFSCSRLRDGMRHRPAWSCCRSRPTATSAGPR